MKRPTTRGDVFDTKTIQDAIAKLKLAAIPPAVCEICGAKFYLFVRGSPVDAPKRFICDECGTKE